MGKWTDRLNAKNSAPPYTPAAKADKRGSEGAFGVFFQCPRRGAAQFFEPRRRPLPRLL